MTYSLRIKDLTISDRPRERLIAQGGQALSSAELLAILLGTGSGKLSAVGLGQLILQTIAQQSSDSVAALQSISAETLMQIPGVGPAKATTILAAIELGKRVFFARPPERTEVTDPSIAAAAFSQDLMWQTQERLAVLLLDHRNRIVCQKLLTIGTVNETIAHPRDIFGEVLRNGGVKLILGHNHPTGNTDPSAQDIALTEQLLQAAHILEIPLLDHLILGNGSFTSMRSVTDLWSESP